MSDVRPREHLARANRSVLGAAWALVDRARAERRPDDADWPPYVWLPLELAGAIVAEAWREERPESLPSTQPEMIDILTRQASELAALSGWRATQGIYRFDQILLENLLATPLEGDLPADALRRLPEWCVYVEAPPAMTVASNQGPVRLHGSFAWVDRERGGGDILTLALDAEGVPLSVMHVPLRGTLVESIDSVAQQWRTNVADGSAYAMPPPDFAARAAETARPILSMLLYLCADNADLGGERPSRPTPTKTKRGSRMFPPDRPRTWDVGVRIGAAIRSAQSEVRGDGDGGDARAGPRPHIRRAHWHHFWRGPREGARELIVRWLPPTLVAADGSSLPAVVRPVQ